MTSILLKGITENPIRRSENLTYLRGIDNNLRDVVRVSGYTTIQMMHPTLTIFKYKERCINDSPTCLKSPILAPNAGLYMSWPSSRIPLQPSSYNPTTRTFSHEKTFNRKAPPIKKFNKSITICFKERGLGSSDMLLGKTEKMKIFEGPEQAPLTSMQGNHNNYRLPCISHGTYAWGDRS